MKMIQNGFFPRRNDERGNYGGYVFIEYVDT